MGQPSQNHTLVFLTIHTKDDKNGGRNPRSVILAGALQRQILLTEELQRRGCAAVILDSLVDEFKSAAPASVAVVPLFDVICGVNCWSPRPSVALGAPSWVRAFSSGSCIAVGSRCVIFPLRVEAAARQITRLFLREHHGDEYPWGPAPSVHRKSRRERDSLRSHRPWVGESHLSRSR